MHASLRLGGEHCQVIVFVDWARGQRNDPISSKFGGQELFVDDNVTDVCCGQGRHLDTQVGVIA